LVKEKKNGTMPLVVFVAEAVSGLLIGFLEASLRSHADGCDPKHLVGFVEGWFVSESQRGKGIGALLLAAAEDWARSHGCIEIASDTWIGHTLSLVFTRRSSLRLSIAVSITEKLCRNRAAEQTFLSRIVGGATSQMQLLANGRRPTTSVGVKPGRFACVPGSGEHLKWKK